MDYQPYNTNTLKVKEIKALNPFVDSSIIKEKEIESLKKNMDEIDKIIQEKNDQLNVVNQNLIEKQVGTPKETKIFSI